MKGKLQEYALVAEIVSAVAIVLSLIFVGFQVRMGAEETAANSEAVKSQGRESMMTSDFELLKTGMVYPYVITSPEWTELSLEEQAIAGNYYFMLARSRENYWVQHQNGMLDDDTYLSYRFSFISTLEQQSGYVDLWRNTSQTMVPGFRAEIDQILKEMGLEP